jgi:glycosyltransferase involved in cell wall biosynthesis
LVALSEVRWGYFRTRKQFLLSRMPPRWRVFFAQPPAFTRGNPWRARREGGVTYFTVPFLKPGTRSALYNRLVDRAPARRALEEAADAWLRVRLRALGVERRPVVMVSNIYAVRSLDRLQPRLVVYDFNDSPFQFDRVPEWSQEYLRRALARADCVFSVSDHYRRWLATQTARLVVPLGNGVEFDHFARPSPGEPPPLAALPRPRLGYVGLLSHFLDFDLLEDIRRARRSGVLVLIGPDTPATRERLAELGRREGVVRLGAVPYAELPAYLQALDVGLIPFRSEDPHVRGINPNKVYQYLAAGLPVVTTPIGDLTPRDEGLFFAADRASFVDAIGRALAICGGAEARRVLAREHDWDSVAARMVSVIEEQLAATRGGN